VGATRLYGGKKLRSSVAAPNRRRPRKRA